MTFLYFPRKFQSHLKLVHLKIVHQFNIHGKIALLKKIKLPFK